ncbi:MAG: hypothetical protein ACRDC4_00805 [Plesiomonas sp.]
MTTVVVETKKNKSVAFCHIKEGQFFMKGGKLFCKPYGSLKDEIFDVAGARLTKVSMASETCQVVNTVTVEAGL